VPNASLFRPDLAARIARVLLIEQLYRAWSTRPSARSSHVHASIYLASQSPRRSALLAELGVAHALFVGPDEDAEALEAPLANGAPAAYVRVSGFEGFSCCSAGCDAAWRHPAAVHRRSGCAGRRAVWEAQRRSRCGPHAGAAVPGTTHRAADCSGAGLQAATMACIEPVQGHIHHWMRRE